jgi:hypothetical protein
MFRRMRERRERDRIYEEQMHRALAEHDRISREIQLSRSAPAPAQSPSVEEEFLPRELRAHTREDLAGMMIRYDQPLVIEGEVRGCPQCGSYRPWVVYITGEDVWLRCPGGHDTYEPRLDAVWFNRNSGPVRDLHASLEDGIKALGL